MPSKQAASSSPSLGRKPNKLKRETAQCLCPICVELITETNGRKEGHDAIVCDGGCQVWLHRRCAGLSKYKFKLASESKAPFFCPHCKSDRLSAEIDSLKALVSNLSNELTEVKKSLDSLPPTRGLSDVSDSVGQPQPASASLLDHSPSSAKSYAQVASANQPQFLQIILKSTTSSSNRKFNIIVYGIPECPHGTLWSSCLRDLNSVSSVVSADVYNNPICQRLLSLQIHPNQSPRPPYQIVRAADVSSILSKK